MHLIVGLGNPGDKYRSNRHNIGFLAVDAIARRHGFPAFREKFQGLVSEGTIDGEKVLLLKPQTFMNTSGDSVQAAAHFYKLDARRHHRALRRARPRARQGPGQARRRQWRPQRPALDRSADRHRLSPRPPRHRPSRPQGPGHAATCSAISPRPTREWLEPAARRASPTMPACSSRATTTAFMNKLAIAVSGDGAERAAAPDTPPTRPARRPRATSAPPAPKAPQAKVPETGPMAAMLQDASARRTGLTPHARLTSPPPSARCEAQRYSRRLSMGFKMGIVGLPNVGKSTLFNALTRTAAAQAANFPFCTIEPNIGEVAVPDARLDKLAKIAKSQQIVPARMSFVDIAGLVKGASKGEGLGNQFLANIRECDAIDLRAALLRGSQHHPRRQQGRPDRRRRSGRDRADARRSRKPRKAPQRPREEGQAGRQGSQARPRPRRPGARAAARGQARPAWSSAPTPTRKRPSTSCSC